MTNFECGSFVYRTGSIARGSVGTTVNAMNSINRALDSARSIELSDSERNIRTHQLRAAILQSGPDKETEFFAARTGVMVGVLVGWVDVRLVPRRLRKNQLLLGLPVVHPELPGVSGDSQLMVQSAVRRALVDTAISRAADNDLVIMTADSADAFVDTGIGAYGEIDETVVTQNGITHSNAIWRMGSAASVREMLAVG